MHIRTLRAPEDQIRILHPGSKTQDQGHSRNHVLMEPHVCASFGQYFGKAPKTWILYKDSTRAHKVPHVVHIYIYIYTYNPMSTFATALPSILLTAAHMYVCLGRKHYDADLGDIQVDLLFQKNEQIFIYIYRHMHT